MKLSIGFSPCPNDTFIFDALINHKIESAGIEWQPVLEDVQTLNEWAREGRLDISKVSYAALPLILDRYITLVSGGALGKGVGPLLIGRTKPEGQVDLSNNRIAIPGEYTTAHMLFSQAYPESHYKIFIPFHQIEDAVLNGMADYGVIIHENRFTYQQKGLFKIADLGEFWEEKTGMPIPLGAIVIKRSMPATVQKEINRLIRNSLEYAFDQYPVLPDYVMEHAQEMDETVMRQHIELYVNEYSLDPGTDGRTAVDRLLQTFSYKPQQPVFIEFS